MNNLFFTLIRAVSRVPSFRQLLVDGNEICSAGVERIQKVLSDAGKELGSMLFFLLLLLKILFSCNFNLIFNI